MKGLTIMTDEKSGKRIAQVDLTHLSKHSEDTEDLLDVLVSEARKNEKNISWDEMKKDLKKKGKL